MTICFIKYLWWTNHQNTCECGGIGRRVGLKIPFRFRSIGSIPIIRTIGIESWLSGRKHRFWKPATVTGPWVRLPHSLPLLKNQSNASCNYQRTLLQYYYFALILKHFTQFWYNFFIKNKESDAKNRKYPLCYFKWW